MYLNTGNPQFLVGKTLECVYNGKMRKGKIVKVRPGVVTIEYGSADKPDYRSFFTRKILGAEVK